MPDLLAGPAHGAWVLRALWVLCAWLALLAPAARAQTLESALSPGALIQGHAKVEAECQRCHVRFDRAAQDGLCIDCHQAVGQDRRGKTGHHGRLKPQPCRACHTDHRGRDMRIASVDTQTFDHQLTDYPLRGKHAAVACARCHKPPQAWRQAPGDCAACHRADDVHKGKLGPACANCHDERSWREARFDHASTRFALTGKHADAKCTACHQRADFQQAPTTCQGCHRADDKHKGRYGGQCESCHGTRDWRSVSFRHDTDTRFALRGRHREIRCDSCHTGHLYRDKLGSACIDCHRQDDKHNTTLGTDCVACHTEKTWRETARFDHDRSAFPLRGAHVKPACRDCHASARYKDTPSDCLACHRRDDKHAGSLGPACANCHTDHDWRASRFAHDRTRFGLRDGHASPPVPCNACHRDTPRFAKTPLDCLSCHRADDKHDGQLGPRCDSCHASTRWKTTRFDHASARFALTGSHVGVACSACHKTLRHRDAPRECSGCHAAADPHKARFGTRCDSCHNVRLWPLWRFDHQRTRYPLAAGHARVACEACHRQPAAPGQAAAALDTACISCHLKDDVHDGAFGKRCESCHAATRWPQVLNRLLGPAPTSPGALPAAPQRHPS